jgi:hypothetical protein
MEFTLGLIGGITGILAALIALIIAGIGDAFEMEGAGEISTLGWFAVLAGVVGIAGSIVVKFHAKVGGILMLVAGVGGAIAISMFWILSGILLIAGGLVGVIRKTKPVPAAVQQTEA